MSRVRALVISDTHFGAWTGEDILADRDTLALLEPHLDVDEVIFLGDMFDFLFGRRREAFLAAEGLLGLLREKLQGRRFVFLAGNHDHHLVQREVEELLELELASGRPGDQLRRELTHTDFFRRYLAARLDGVEVEIRYPTYTFGDVLCTHGHYLDFYARRSGAAPGRLLARTLWAIAIGGDDHEPTVEDFEATTAMLTGLLYTIAQLPNGTEAQRRVFNGFKALGRLTHLGSAPVRAVEQAGGRLAKRLSPHARDRLGAVTQQQMEAYEGARNQEQERQRRTGAPGGAEVAKYAIGQVVRPSDPAARAVEAFEQVVERLGWARGTDKVVFAHTHQPLEDVTGPSGKIRYWNTGSWIYEPDLSSHEAYLSYLRNAWPGTAVMIDSDEPHPRLLRLRERLNPLSHMDAGQTGAGR
jgi:UDP-2,3-diacylglucosamine pyrophosphatase LpxH